MKNLLPLLVLVVCLVIAFASWSFADTPVTLSESRDPTTPTAYPAGALGPRGVRVDTLWTIWDFNGGSGDSSGFRSYDRRVLRDDLDSLYWHATSLQAVNGSRSMWCGGHNDRSGSWLLSDGGYGNYWQQIMQLELGPFAVTLGCSLGFNTRYVAECDYDYCYLEYYSFVHDAWRPIDNFTGKSGCITFCNPCYGDWNNYCKQNACVSDPWGQVVAYPGDWRGGGPSPPDWEGYSYGGGASGNDFVIIPGDSISNTPGNTLIRLRWRFSTDMAGSAADGNAYARGFWLDGLVVKTDVGTVFTDDFEALPEGGLPGLPWSFPHLEGIYDGWALRYDLDPPSESPPLFGSGADDLPPACLTRDASWQWSIADSAGAIPPPPEISPSLPGYQVYLETPALPIWAPNMFVAWEEYMCMPGETCDHTDASVQIHLTSGIGPWAGLGVWSPWYNLDGYAIYGCSGADTMETKFEDLSYYASLPGADSIRFAWISFDTGLDGKSCWMPVPPPHEDTQYVVDNVRVGCWGCDSTSVGDEAEEFVGLRLGWAAPNPSNPSATISYEIPAGAGPSDVLLRILSPLGRHVATLVEAPRSAGSYTATWDGRDLQGDPVASGVYFYRLEWNGRSETKRLVLVR